MKHIETIICPECGKVQLAEVIHTIPWWCYVHYCEDCSYVILESEWISGDKDTTNP